MHRIDEVWLLAAADRHRRWSRLVGLILLEPDFGTAMSLLMVVARDGLCCRTELSLPRRHRAGRGYLPLYSRDRELAVSAAARCSPS